MGWSVVQWMDGWPARGNPQGVSPAKWPQAAPADLRGKRMTAWLNTLIEKSVMIDMGQRFSTNPCSRALHATVSAAICIQFPPASCTNGSDHRVSGRCRFRTPRGVQSKTCLDHRSSFNIAKRPAKRHLVRLCWSAQFSIRIFEASLSTVCALLCTKSIHGSKLPSGVLSRWRRQT